MTAVEEAWDTIDELELRTLVREVPAPCQAVTDANGMYTEYLFFDLLNKAVGLLAGNPCWWHRPDENHAAVGGRINP